VSRYLATPAGDGPWPGVVVLHESFGVNHDIRTWTDRFAGEGYLALAPDLLEGGPRPLCLVNAFRALIRGHGAAVEQVVTAREELAERADCTGRVGVIGFCMGGGFALLTAARGFDVAAPNYGHLPSKPAEALAGSCPMVASYGKKDLSLRGSAAKLERMLEEHGVEHDVKEYADASHSFLNDHEGVWRVADRVLGIGLREEAADDAWRRIRGFFAAHLSGEPSSSSSSARMR
jgi:carboxymethylenebutenolidase